MKHHVTSGLRLCHQCVFSPGCLFLCPQTVRSTCREKMYQQRKASSKDWRTLCGRKKTRKARNNKQTNFNTPAVRIGHSLHALGLCVIFLSLNGGALITWLDLRFVYVIASRGTAWDNKKHISRPNVWRCEVRVQPQSFSPRNHPDLLGSSVNVTPYTMYMGMCPACLPN